MQKRNTDGTFSPMQLEGKKFGKLTVLRRAENNRAGSSQWLCKCECGNEKVVSGYRLKIGKTKSCGCLRGANLRNINYKHGLGDTRLAGIYKNMLNRCYSTENTHYKYYGGKGVKVCKEWLSESEGFLNFYNWAISNGYSEDLTIDREDVNGDYTPSNCRWVDYATQANNRTSNRYFTFNGETRTVTEWCSHLGGSPSLIYSRLRLGWSVERALSTPVIRRKGDLNGKKPR